MTGNSKNRLAFLDGLRGLAAIYVLAYHVIMSPQPPLAAPDYIGPVIQFGYSGVVLFFVVSAFSLCFTMPRHEATRQPLLSFAVSRFFRIAPLFYVLVGYQVWRVHGNVDPQSLLASLSLLFNLSPAFAASLAWAGWTVGAEVLFYIAFPAIYAASGLKLSRLSVFVLVGVAISLSFWQYRADDPAMRAYHLRSILTFLPTFLIGMLSFVLWEKGKNSPHREKWGLAALAAGVTILLVRSYVIPRLVFSPWCAVDAAAYGLILIGAGLYDFRIMRARALRFYGKISYSVYLWHTVVIFWLMSELHRIYGIALPVGLKYSACFVLVLAVTTAIAYGTYRIIEQPGEWLGKRIFARLRLNKQAPVAAE